PASRRLIETPSSFCRLLRIDDWSWKCSSSSNRQSSFASSVTNGFSAIRLLLRMHSPNVILLDHPVIQTKLTELRDFTTDHRKFRALLDEIAGLMVYEVTRDWPTKAQPLQTPLERTTGRVLAREVTLVPIRRSGPGVSDGVLRLL